MSALLHGIRHRPHPVPPDTAGVDARALERDLRGRLRGEVRFDEGSRALYAADASNYRLPPIGVVIPRDEEDIVQAVAAGRAHGAPILTRGCGTSLAGQCCNVALVIDASKYVHRVLGIDAEARRARVQPGCILDHLREEAAPHGLTWGPDPATHSRCTLGGMLGNNSCGIHAVFAEFYGPGPTTAHQVETLDVLTYDGLRLTVGPTPDEELQRILQAGGRRADIYRRLRALRDRHARAIRERFPNIIRRVSGYNLPALLPENGFNVARALVGSESTCVTILGATVTLMRNLEHRALVVLGYPSVYDAGDHVPELRELKPVGLEGMDELLVEYNTRKGIHGEALRLLPEGRGWLFVEFGGDTQEEATGRAREAMEALRGRTAHPPTMVLHDDREGMAKLWEARESGLGATAFVPGQPDTWPGWEDSAVPVDKVGDYLRDLRKLYDRYGYHPSLYGHFGQGCIHCRVDFDLTNAAGIAKFRAFMRDAAELVCQRYGGSLSGEHGDGQARGELLPIMFGEELMDAFREFKAIWDPQGRMNPGKVVDARPLDADLRLGADYRPWTPATHFQFPEDGGDFAHATLRCVGVGVCRRTDGGTMCPSFMALREEQHTTRGRAHLLFEMLQGQLIRDGWRSEAVRESLDLCLACKGCKGDCPLNVDMATYKAEFLSHYYDGRLRPRSAYAFGLIPWWARLAARVPDLVNFLAHAPGLGAVGKRLTGMAPERRVPFFARETFRERWRRRRGPARDGRPNVILWPDTFNDHFYPATLEAAADVLEAAGFHVTVPATTLCCGRPLYDYGMLDTAKSLLDRTLAALRPQIEAGVPVVGLEPSCVSVFRDEMAGLLPHDADARRLRGQTYLLSEFLAKHAPDFVPPKLERRAIVQGHCHHKSVLDFDSERALLERMGLEATVLDSGCCGMAGSFGFERDKYDVSLAIGERVLLPAVRAADADTLIVADGFSCREQIAQATDRRALHLADVLRMAMERQRGRALDGERALAAIERDRREHAITTGVVAGIALAVAGAWLAARRRR